MLALLLGPRHPSCKLSPLGNGFLKECMCAGLTNPALDSVCIIDSPGATWRAVAHPQRHDFAEVLEWFAL